ncbi:MAG: alpha/beta hydrolase [Rubrivivax sp.]|nr:alpha/beta hydrolase [Rubrivivax sp.]
MPHRLRSCAFGRALVTLLAGLARVARVAPGRRGPAGRARLALALAAGIAFAAGPAGAAAATFDLCVRGTGVGVNRVARLTLEVSGSAVAAADAPRLGALLANQRLWSSEAEEVFGAPFDAELCGEAVAPVLRLAVTLDATQVRQLLDGPVRAAAAAAQPTQPAQPTRSMRGDAAAAGTPARGGPPADGLVRDARGNVQYQIVRVHYATNRKDGGVFAVPDERFGGERGSLSFGVAQVTIPKTHRVGALEAPSLLRLEFRPDPTRHVVLTTVEALTHDAWRAEIAKRATALGNAGILVFIHGYNVAFADAARRAGQLSYDLGFAGPTVLFSWPSRGGLTDYTVDEQSAEWSIPDMRDVLASLATVAPGTPVYVIAHSMGNRVLTRGFKSLLDQDPRKLAAFRQIVLAAPDIDADVFRREIGPAILGKGPRVTLYASSNDKALVASRKVHGGYKRLGESGDGIVVMSGLDTVDASNVSTEFLGHSYFGDNTTVMSDLMYVIQKSLPPQERTRFALEPVRAAIGQYWRFKNN